MLQQAFILCTQRKLPDKRGRCCVDSTCRKRLFPPHLFFAKFQQSRESAPLSYGGGHWNPRCLLPIVISLCPGARNSTGSVTFTTPFSCGFSSLESSLMWVVAGSISPVCSLVLRLPVPLKCPELKSILLKLYLNTQTDIKISWYDNTLVTSPRYNIVLGGLGKKIGVGVYLTTLVRVRVSFLISLFLKRGNQNISTRLTRWCIHNSTNLKPLSL